MEEKMEILLSMVAILISLWSLFVTSKYNKKFVEIQQESAKLSKLQRFELQRQIDEREKCELSAYWYIGTNDSDRIAIRNTGGVDAFNVRFRFDPKNGLSAPLVPGNLDKMFPIEKLRSGDEFNFVIAPHSETGKRWPVIVMWENEAGKGFSKDFVLGG